MNTAKMSVTAKIQSNVGFYIGDICYVLEDSLYAASGRGPEERMGK